MVNFKRPNLHPAFTEYGITVDYVFQNLNTGYLSKGMARSSGDKHSPQLCRLVLFVLNKEVNGVLTLIALSIFADKRILSSEITFFIKSATAINKKVKSDTLITEAKLLAWFENNRITLRDKTSLGPVGFEHWFKTVLADVSDFKDKSFIMDMIQKIAEADGEVHVSEKALLALLDRNSQS